MSIFDKYNTPTSGGVFSKYASAVEEIPKVKETPKAKPKNIFSILPQTTPEIEKQKKNTYVQGKLAHVEGPPEFKTKMQQQFEQEYEQGQHPISNALTATMFGALPAAGLGVAETAGMRLAQGAGLGKALAPAIGLGLGVAGYAGLNQVIDIPNMLPANTTPWVKDVAGGVDFLTKGAILGGLGLGAIEGKRAYERAKAGVIDIKGEVVEPTKNVPAEVPLSKLVDSHLVTSTPEGTQIEPNLSGQFTADQNVKARVAANNIVNDMNIKSAVTGNQVVYGHLPTTFRNIITNKILELQHTGSSSGQIQENIQNYINQERSNIQSPLIIISGIGKGSELKEHALDASLEVDVVPFMGRVSLRDLATDLAARGIDPSNARYVYHALTPTTHGVPDLVRQTVQSLWFTAVNRGQNVLEPPTQPPTINVGESIPTVEEAAQQVIKELPPEPTPSEPIHEEVEQEIKRMNKENDLARAKETLYGPEDYDPHASITQPDVMIVKQYYDTMKERNEQLFHTKDKAARRWAEDFYKKELENIYETMTPGQRSIIDEGNKEKVLEEYYDDMVKNLQDEEAPCVYTGITAKEHFEIEDTAGKTHFLLGSYVMYSKIGENWKFGLWPNSEGYKIQDGDKFEVTRDVFENTVRKNVKENSNALKFDDLNISAGGLTDGARAIHNSLAPANAKDIKKVKDAVRLGQEINVPLITALQKTAPGRKLLAAAQAVFGKEAVVKKLTLKPKLSLTDELFDYFKNERPYKDFYAGMAKKLIMKYLLQAEGMNNKAFPGLKRNQYQEKGLMDAALMSSANPEIYCKEGDPDNFAVTTIGTGGPHLPGQFTATSEADGFLRAFQPFNNFYHFEEPWLRQQFNIPPDVPVEQYLSLTRPSKFFYTLLTHPKVCPDDTLQRITREMKAHLETPELNKLLDAGILDKGAMADKVSEGFTNRVWAYADTGLKGTQVATRRAKGDPQSPATIASAKYRTYEEYLYATGSWELPPDLSKKEGLQKAIEQQRLSGRGLVPINNIFSQMQEYILDSELTVQQYKNISWLKGYEIPGMNGLHWVEYERGPEIEKRAKKEGFQTTQQYLTVKGFEQVKGAPGLVQWYQGGHDDPWMQGPLINLLKGLYSDRGDLRVERVNEFLTFLRRIETMNPFQHINLYLASMYANPQFIVKAPGMFMRSMWEAPGIASKMALGKYVEPTASEEGDLQKWLQYGLVPAGKMSTYLKSVFGKMELGKYGLQESMWQHYQELAATGLGLQTALWEHYMGPMNVAIARMYRDSFIKKGYTESQAYRYATDLVNTCNMMTPSWQYFGQGPFWRGMLYASNLFIGPLNVYANSAYGITKLPGMKFLRNMYKYRDTPVVDWLNPIFGNNSKEELNATWKAYLWHTIREIMMRLAIGYAIQYTYGKVVRGLKDGDKGLYPHNNPRGYQMAADVGEIDGHEQYLDVNAMRTAMLGYDFTLGKGVFPILQNKANIQINWLFSIHDYYNKFGNLPAIIRNANGDVVGGQLIDFINGVKSTITPLGLHPGDKPISWTGLNLREGPALMNDDVDTTDEAHRAERLQSYFRTKAKEELRKEGAKPEDVAEKYGLTAKEINSMIRPPKVPKGAMRKYEATQ